jgi:hypothetical protein
MHNVRVAPPIIARDAAKAVAPDLSILIVTWNSANWIDRCLRSLPAACEGLSYEVVVYDNASTDGTLRRLPDDSARVIRSSRNDGFAAATNRALATSSGPFVFLLNPDCELGPRSLTLLCEFLEQHPNAAAAAPHLLDQHGDSQREFQLRRLPTRCSSGAASSTRSADSTSSSRRRGSKTSTSAAASPRRRRSCTSCRRRMRATPEERASRA